MSPSYFFRALALPALASLASAASHVVAPTPGPGIDFTTIGAAIAASAPGDVILVRAGTYTTFTVDRGVTLLGDSGAVLTAFTIAGIPAAQRAVVSGFAISPAGGGANDIGIHQCAGPVLLERLATIYGGVFLTEPSAALAIDGCADVRMRACIHVAVNVATSRLEITGCSMQANTENPGCSFGCSSQQGQHGRPTLECRNGSEVHVAASNITGGEGGHAEWDASVCPSLSYPGVGGDGISVLGGTVLLTGSGVETVEGGAGGYNQSPCSQDGDAPPGLAIRNVGGTLLYSGVQFFGGTVGSVMHEAPADPCLLASGAGAAGTPMTFTVVGQPGDEARLRLGRRMVVEDLQFVFEDRLTVPLRSYQLGILPASGSLSFTLNLPSTLPLGTVLVAQGSTSNPTETRLTQSAPVVVH